MTDNKQNRNQLLEEVASLIELSFSLSVNQKDWLQNQLPSLTGKQLQKLLETFENESVKKNEMLKSFFEKHPHLYDDYNRETRVTVSSTYQDIEKQELVNEETIMNELLQKLNA